MKCKPAWMLRNGTTVGDFRVPERSCPLGQRNSAGLACAQSVRVVQVSGVNLRTANKRTNTPPRLDDSDLFIKVLDRSTSRYARRSHLVWPKNPLPRTSSYLRLSPLRACFKIAWGPAASDFGCGQGGEAGASPQRAVTAESTQAADKRPAARRVFGEKADWLRCSSVADRWRISSLVAPRHPAFSAKTGPHGILKQALSRNYAVEVPSTVKFPCESRVS